mmetsp:Transcript_50401/g.155864  ORF Transcript_50401/g.155864 Transcript_50401/m.155864 type:complete len:221 (-) Transcript_50401:519-1181(-)
MHDGGFRDATGADGGVHPAVWVRVVVLLMGPAQERNIDDVVHPVDQRLEQLGAIVRTGAVRRSANDGDWQHGVPEVCGPHPALPAPGRVLGELPHDLLLHEVFQLPLRPSAQLLQRRVPGHRGLAECVPAPGAGRIGQREPGYHDVVLRGVLQPARERVAAEDEHHVWPRRYCDGLGLLVERVQLKLVLLRTQKVQDHQLGGEEQAHPEVARVHGQLWRL